MLYLLPIIIAVIATIILASRSEDKLYSTSEINLHGRSEKKLDFKVILKYFGIFVLISGGLYLLAIIAPIIIGIIVIGAFLSSLRFFVFFRI